MKTQINIVQIFILGLIIYISTAASCCDKKIAASTQTNKKYQCSAELIGDNIDSTATHNEIDSIVRRFANLFNRVLSDPNSYLNEYITEGNFILSFMKEANGSITDIRLAPESTIKDRVIVEEGIRCLMSLSFLSCNPAISKNLGGKSTYHRIKITFFEKQN